MTAETIINEFEGLAPTEKKKVLDHLLRRSRDVLNQGSRDEAAAGDAEFDAVAREVVEENRELLRRLAQ